MIVANELDFVTVNTWYSDMLVCEFLNFNFRKSGAFLKNISEVKNTNYHNNRVSSTY